MLFSSWDALVRIVVVGACAYVALVVLLRTTGKRTLSKLNAFDFVVTIAIGSTLSSTLLDRSVSLAGGVIAMGLLVLMQLVVARAIAWSSTFEHVARAAPTIVFLRGEYVDDALENERLTRDDLRSAMRKAKASSIDDVEAVVLETSGELSVVLYGVHGRATPPERSTLPRKAAARTSDARRPIHGL